MMWKDQFLNLFRITWMLNTSVQSRSVLHHKALKSSSTLAHPICGCQAKNVPTQISPAVSFRFRDKYLMTQ
jgi:hypothetical protein